MVLPFNVALYSGVSVAALFAAAGADAYAVGGNAPEFVADFAGVLNSGTEYYRSGGSDTTFSSVFTHSGLVAPATMTDSDGVLKWAPHNFSLKSQEIASWTTQSGIGSFSADATSDPDGGSNGDEIIEDSASSDARRCAAPGNVIPDSSESRTVTYKIWCKAGTGTRYPVISIYGTASVYASACWDLSGGSSATQTLNSGSPTVVATSKTAASGGWYLLSLTISGVNSTGFGYIIAAGMSNATTFSNGDRGFPNYNGDGTSSLYFYGAHVYRSDLGGMVNNPDRGDSYVPTTTAARFLPRRNHHVYNGTSWENAGILIEPAAATNLLLNSGTLSTQSVTVTAVAHTLHFTGTGTITLSGASTAGPLVGTGTGENNRVSLTFTPSAGSLTCTVSGTVTNAQLEVGSVPTSYIPTAGTTVTRAAETLTVAGANLPYSATAMSFNLNGKVSFANQTVGGAWYNFIWQISSSDRIIANIDTIFNNGVRYDLSMNNGGSPQFENTQTAYNTSAGLNQDFSWAGRVSTSSANQADLGTANTASTGSYTIPNVSSQSMQIMAPGSTNRPSANLSMFRMWGTGLSDADLESAT